MSASCVRIDPKDFHGPEAEAYTQRALEELAESKQFKSYMNHIDYKERLHLTWFLIPLGLVSVFYYHLSVFSPDFTLPIGALTGTALEERAAQAPGLPYATLFVLLFLLPCTLVAPFAGFFEEPSAGQSFRLLVLFTLVNAVAVSYGDFLFHHPPFLHALPPIPWENILVRKEGDNVGLSLATALKILIVRVTPLQGFLLAGYTVSRWQRAFWRRVWHLPLPLLTVPLFVGVSGVTFWRMSSLTLPYFLSSNGEPTNATTYSCESILTDPRGVLSLWRRIVAEMSAVMVEDIKGWAKAGAALPSVLVNPVTCAHAYLAGMSLTILYFAVVAVKPFLEFLLGGVCLVLPVDPTLWGLTMLSSVGALVTLLRMEVVMLYYVAAAASLAFLLLYNGFVA